MRTKALLACAALAVGLATSAVAQSNVYSLNIVGYVNTPLVSGFNLIANPLDNGTNDLNSLFPNAGFGDTIYTWNGAGFDSAVNVGAWSPNPTIPPGAGFFYNSGANSSNTFVGNVLTGNLTNHLAAGFALVASKVPISDTLSGLQFTGNFGDTVYYWRNGGYVSSVNIGSWNPDLTVGVGEGFFVNSGAAQNWVQTFNP